MKNNNKITKPIVFFDIETTGIDTEKDEIIQFCGVRVEPNGKTTQCTFLCKPNVPIAKEASDVHGHTEKSLKNEQPFKDYVADVVALFKDADVSGYNCAAFDVVITDRQLRECGHKGVFDQSRIYDTFLLYKDRHRQNLTNCYKHYTGKDLVDAHDAVNDIKATIEIFNAQMAMETGSIEEVFEPFCPPPGRRVGFTNHIIIDEHGNMVVNFGKYKGTLLNNVEFGFIRWAAGQNFPEEVKQVFTEQLKKMKG